MKKNQISAKIGQGTLFLIFSLIVICAFFSIMKPTFLTASNFRDVFLRMSVTTPIALGIMFTLVVKGIDLSSGTILGLVGIVVAHMIKAKIPLGYGIIVGLSIGLLVGVIDGILVAKLNMNPFVATLAIMYVGMSFEKVMTNGGLPVYLSGTKNSLKALYRADWFGIPIPVVMLIAIVFIMWLFSERTIAGRRLQASGQSTKGAENAGIRVRSYYAAAYIISGVLSAVSGIIICSQIQAGQPLVGQGYLWDAIGAAYLSTTMSKTSRPNVLGTLFGVLFLCIVNNGLVILGLPFYWKQFFAGFIILFILLTSVVNKAVVGKRELSLSLASRPTGVAP
jgi:ribose/xylose/arabinose/galactoside ABC-type transport system permease subunit